MGISVLLADDHGVLRDGVRRLLEANSDIRVTATADDGRAAVEQAVKVTPDVALVDIAMPGISGIEVARCITTQVPRTAVVILSMYSSAELVREALRAGARGYLLKESAGDDVVKAVRAVVAGKRFLGEGIADTLIDGCLLLGRSGVIENLTARERDVVRLVAEGKSNAEAAAALGLSPRSVETYRLRLMQKLGLDDLPALVKFAIRHGITTLE
jgi:DNA-binding NarL/FixJ family response regulator